MNKYLCLLAAILLITLQVLLYHNKLNQPVRWPPPGNLEGPWMQKARAMDLKSALDDPEHVGNGEAWDITVIQTP